MRSLRKAAEILLSRTCLEGKLRTLTGDGVGLAAERGSGGRLDRDAQPEEIVSYASLHWSL